MLDITGYHVMIRLCGTNETASTRAPENLASSLSAYATLNVQTSIILQDTVLAEDVETHTRL